MFQIVRQEQELLPLQVTEQLRPGIRAACAVEREPDRLGDHRHNELSFADGRQRDEIYAVGKRILHARGRLDRQSRLADAARAGQCQQAAFRPAQELAQLLHLALAADQRGRQYGKVGFWEGNVCAGARPERRKQALGAQITSRRPHERCVLLRGHVEAVRHQPGDLPGGAPLAGLDFAQRGDRAADPTGKLLAREPEFLTALPEPLSKRDRGLHRVFGMGG